MSHINTAYALGASAATADFEKQAKLPSYLKGMTQKQWGVSKVTDWPKDPRLKSVMEQWQSGRQNAPLFRKSKPERRAAHKELMAAPKPEGSAASKWTHARQSLRGE